MKAQYFLVLLLCYAVQGGLSKFWVTLLYSIKVWQSEIHQSDHSTRLQIFIKRIPHSQVKSLKNLLAFDNRPVLFNRSCCLQLFSIFQKVNPVKYGISGV